MLPIRFELMISTLLVWRLTNLAIEALYDMGWIIKLHKQQQRRQMASSLREVNLEGNILNQDPQGGIGVVQHRGQIQCVITRCTYGAAVKCGLDPVQWLSLH
ncbi:hypothetical protein ACU8KH_04131 [Lachancea thermotolerans]